MESPVRICLGAALVVNLLLLSSTTVGGNAIPDTTSTTVKDERAPRYNRVNGTWLARNRPKTPDVSLNELNPKDSTSEEHTEKNAKYKDRGRVRFQAQLKSSTESSLRRKSTEAPSLVIVTPTAEVKKPAEIVDSMRNYKTKLPTFASSTTPVTVKKEVHSEETYDEEDNDEEKDSFEKFTSSKFDTNFFTIPSFNYGDDFTHDSDNESSDNKVKNEYSSPSYGGFSSFFPREASYGYKDTTHDIFKSESFFDFNSDLTTPKNDYFDQKFQRISTSIIKNLDTIKAKATPPNATHVHKIIKENMGLERMNNNTPTNKSSVFIKNTKEIRLLDNDGAGSANKELSDVQGTSIYYEMSVLSTETYAINHDYDCDNDTLPSAPTPSTSSEDELASLKAVEQPVPIATRPTLPDPSPESISISSSNYLPVSSVLPIINSVSPFPVSTQNSVSSTEKVTKKFSSTFNRNRSYSKRLNVNGNKDSPNSVTIKPEYIITSTLNPRLQTRKFHHTTPKNRPIWMVPRRNITKVYQRPSNPSTIYSEHFSIKEKTTSQPRQPSRTMLTTVSSDIDPVQQSDISGTKKVVQSQTISDNSVPSLWKRGSTRFGSSTVTSAEVETEAEWQIPPTSTAWALASLRSPPPSPGAVVNGTRSTQKNVDENELQKVGEVLDKKETTTASTTTTTANPISNDIIPKVTEVVQNKLSWQGVSSRPSSEIKTETKSDAKQTAESNISLQNSAEPATTQTKMSENPTEASWVAVTTEADESINKINDTDKETIPPVDATKSTGFESITKLPADITTPQDESVASSEVNQTITEEKPKPTTDYEITTIRFSYVPTEEVETETQPPESTTPSMWHPAFPTRTRITTIKDSPITTYRPRYITTESEEDTSTILPETTSPIEVSSQILENATRHTEITETPTELSTGTQTEAPTTTEQITQTATEEVTTQPTTMETSEQPTTEITVTVTSQATTSKSPTTMTVKTEDITTIVTEIVTEINTERETRTSSTPGPETTETSPSELNESDCTEENSVSNEVITQETLKPTTEATTRPSTAPTTTTTEENITNPPTTTEYETTTQRNARIHDTTVAEITTDSNFATKTDSGMEEETSYGGDMTTEASSRVLGEEDNGSGAAVAIAVSTIGVIALILLIGLLLVVRRRGRRGIYAQRCTPVSLDAYSLDSVSVGHRKGNHRLRASKRSYGNPAYDDEVTSHPMQYAALANFALDIESMTAEFSEIPSVTVRPDEVPPGCEDKNRYSNVLPLPETRVPLKRLGNDPTTEYINANFVTGPGNIRNYYILCQAPLSNTVVDFWRMIWEQNSRLVVMLTEYMENGVEKCYEYLPPSEISDNKRIFGDFKIILKKREQRDKYAISSVQLINLNTRTWREITHLWYFWPAKGVPDDYDSVIDFMCEMRSYMKISQTAKEYDEEGVEVIYGDQNRSSFSNLSKLRSDESGSGNGVNVYSPSRAEEQMRRAVPTNGTLGRMKAASEVDGIRACVVTCASGAGRSAALVALDVCARALPGAADVPRVVRQLRAQRPHSLSNRHHYIFLYKVLSEYGNKMLGGGVDTI
ncbi:flocculation protein FLO11 [Trichoplusia ni]|uniref:Flocculation protein FLO11 n=1 Tax=Trichoplusia ni TaxID=7111 RepID=A0A7E5WKS6_TRINI|nr:flocculation protein FLO11 [Trichoplusia ni]XP_026741333.1 flocculation protein FLO11 [Trichoplusia ni]